MIRLPPRSTLSSSSAASDVYKRQSLQTDDRQTWPGEAHDARPQEEVQPQEVEGLLRQGLQEVRDRSDLHRSVRQEQGPRQAQRGPQGDAGQEGRQEERRQEEKRQEEAEVLSGEAIPTTPR